MRITQIEFTNLMGASAKLALAPLHCIYGRNMTGKSRVRYALELALIGYIPALGKRPSDTMLAASGARRLLSVRAIPEQGPVISRTWRKDDEGKITTKHSAPPIVPPMTLDASVYFELSPRKRVELLASLAEVDADESLRAELDAAAAEVALSRCSPGESLQDMLERLTAETKEALSLATAEARRFAGALQGVTQLQEADEPATRSIEQIDADIEKAIGDQAAARAEKTQLAEQNAKNEMLELRREQLTAELENIGEVGDVTESAEALAEKAEVTHARWVEARAKESAWREHERMVAQITTRIAQHERIKPKGDTHCKACGQTLPVGEQEKHLAAYEATLAKLKADIQQAQRDAEEAKPEEAPEVLQAEWERQMDDAKRAARAARARGIRAELETLPRTPAQQQNALGEATAREEQATLRLAALREERTRAEYDRADRKRLAESRDMKQAAELRAERLKEFATLLREKQSGMIEKAVRPLLAAAAIFTDGIFQSPLEYRDGTLGMMDAESGTYIHEATFTGSQRAISRAALQAALGAQSAYRIVIMDELANIDETFLRRFMSNVAKAREAGIIEQFIGIVPALAAPYFPGFTFTEARGTEYVTI